MVYAVGVEGGQRPRPVPGQPRPHGQRVARCARAATAARPGASIRASPASSASGSSTYISTPWQSTTSKLPGRKCTPVSRPSPSTAGPARGCPPARRPAPHGPPSSISGPDSSPVTVCPARASRSACVPWPMPTSSTRSRCPTGKRAAICSSSCRATSSWRTTLRSPPSLLQPGGRRAPGEPERPCSGPLSALDLRLRQPQPAHLERAHQARRRPRRAWARSGSARPAASSGGSPDRSSRRRSARSRRATAAARCSAATPTRTMLSTRMTTASGRKNSAMQKRESTKSRANRRTGPLSRAGRYRSSPLASASRCLAMSARRASRWRLAASLRSSACWRTLRRWVWASLRLGVGRPFGASRVAGLLGVVRRRLVGGGLLFLGTATEHKTQGYGVRRHGPQPGGERSGNTVRL